MRKTKPARKTAAQKRETNRRRQARFRASLAIDGKERVELVVKSGFKSRAEALGRKTGKHSLAAVCELALQYYAERHLPNQENRTAGVRELWPQVRPLLPYLTALAAPDARIRIGDRIYTHEDYEAAQVHIMQFRKMAREWGAASKEEEFALLDTIARSPAP